MKKKTPTQWENPSRARLDSFTAVFMLLLFADLMTSGGKILERTKRTRTLEGETLIECLVEGFE